jgi:hypothetical protein
MPRGWPLLRQAPARMLHNGALAALILLSVALLAGLVAAGPVFGSATNAGGLTRQLATIPETTAASLRPVVQVSVHNGPPAAAEPRIRALVDDVPFIADPQTSVFGDAWHLDQRHPTPYLLAGATRLPAVLYFRTGAVDGLQIVSGKRGAPGLWVPEAAADDLGLRPGSRIQIGKTFRYTIPSCGSPFLKLLGKVSGDDTKTTIAVAGTYRTAADGKFPLGPYFSRISSGLPSDPGQCPSSALLLIGDRATVDTALTAVKEMPTWTYTAKLTALGQTPEHLRRAAAAAAGLRLKAAQPGSEVADLMAGSGDFQIDSGLPAIHRKADLDAVAARQQGRGIAYAGGALGLAAVVVALRALAQRRRRETELLLGLGTPTWIVVAAGTIELLLPTVLGAGAGWAATCLIFRWFGPYPQLDPAAVQAAALAAALVAGVTLFCNALVMLGQARAVSRTLEGRPESRWGSQWLPLLTGATVLAVIATLTRDREQSYQDPMAALLPILVLACGCSIVARVVGAAVAGIRRRGQPAAPMVSVRPNADRLVLRGLRRTGVAVADLIIVLGVGVGVLAYGLLSSAQVNRSVMEKATVLAGASSSAHIAHSWLLEGGDGPSPRLPASTSIVWRGSGVLTPDNRVYDLLVVNPTSLRDAASWGSGPELAEAKAALSAFGQPPADPARIASADQSALPPIPALVVGPSDRSVGSTAQLAVAFQKQPIEIRRHLTAFPGAVRPTLVLDARSYFPRLGEEEDPSHQIDRVLEIQGDYATWIWSRQSLKSVLQLMGAHGIPTQETFTLDQALATPVLTSGRWAAGYQVVLGWAAAMLAGLAVVVAVDRRVARAAPVDLILRRFGVRPARLLGLRTLELALTALGALAVLVIPLALMVVLLPRLVEPDTALPPEMPVQVTAPPLLLSVWAAVGVMIVAAMAAARRSASLNPGEVLRDDT